MHLRLGIAVSYLSLLAATAAAADDGNVTETITSSTVVQDHDHNDLHDYPTANLLPPRRARSLGIYVCNRENWKGACWWAPAKGKACQAWDDIHSFGPENGLACDLFEGEDCKGKMALRFVTFPGVDMTPESEVGLRSWRCGSY